MRGPRKPRDARRTGTSLDTRRLRLTFPQMVLILFEFSPSFCFSGFFLQEPEKMNGQKILASWQAKILYDSLWNFLRKIW